MGRPDDDGGALADTVAGLELAFDAGTGAAPRRRRPRVIVEERVRDDHRDRSCRRQLALASLPGPGEPTSRADRRRARPRNPPAVGPARSWSSSLGRSGRCSSSSPSQAGIRTDREAGLPPTAAWLSGASRTLLVTTLAGGILISALGPDAAPGQARRPGPPSRAIWAVAARRGRSEHSIRQASRRPSWRVHPGPAAGAARHETLDGRSFEPLTWPRRPNWHPPGCPTAGSWSSSAIGSTSPDPARRPGIGSLASTGRCDQFVRRGGGRVSPSP